MNIYPEIKQIVELNEKITHLIEKLSSQLDVDGCDFNDAYFVKNCEEISNHLYDSEGNQLDNDSYGLIDSDYYCCQYRGYCEDDFHGTLYFKTDVPGQFVAIPFNI